MVVQNDCERNVDFSLSPKNDAKKHRLKQRFDVRQKLGQGTYGKVQLAVNKDSGQEVAIKTIKKSKIESEQDLIRIRREIQIMSSIQHPHIIHIYEVFENKDKIVLVMQFASGGELYDYLSEKKVLSDLEARRIFRQIAAAVYYCHKNKICHRDLKLENILLDEKGNAKIADFGLSNVFDERHLLKTYCGSPLYASPEIVKGVPYYGPEVDCWSMGVLLYTLVYGAMPFDGSNFKKLVTQISEGDYFEPKKKSKASDLIHKLLTVSPLKRATIVDICTDNWVNQGYEHSLLQVAEDMANLTPVRLDLLLALAPASPIPTDDDDLREESPKDTFESDVLEKSNMAKDVEDEDEEDDDEEDNVETATNSFAYIRASQASNLSASTPDIQRTGLQEDEGEFLPADVIAALENHCTKRGPERSFDGSISRVSSVAHKSKKPRKSESMLQNKESTVALNEVGEENSQNNKDLQQVSSKKNIQATSRGNDSNVKNQLQDKGLPQDKGPAYGVQGRKSISKINKEEIEKMKQESTCDASTVPQLDANNQEKLKPEVKKRGRSPGKIIIPKTFESPQSTPSPKTQQGKSSPSTPPLSDTIAKKNEKSQEGRSSMNEPEDTKNVTTTSETKSIKSDSSSENVSKPELVSEERKQIAKGILKKGIAKAKLAERKLSQQSSTETEAVTPPPVKTSEAAPSFFKAPKPYTKEEEKQVQSKAEIVLSPPVKTPDTNKSNNLDSKAPLWDSAVIPTNKQSRNLSWGTVSSTIDSEMNNWREQMEESLRRLSPENEQEKSITSSKADEDEHLVPIARSYKKFTFTKDGACITETKKIYTTPGADGSWTKVEKKTRITTRPGNVEEFEKLRDLHLRNDSPLTKSDSQSSSGSTEVYDDIFDSWTGDTMMCNMMKIKNMFQKFSRDPFLRTERRRNPFRNFHRTESDRGERSRRRAELRSGHSTDKDSSDNDEDYEVSFDSSNPVVYGSQGLWQFLRSSNKRIPRRVTVVEPDHSTYTRSVSQDRSETKLNNWKRTESRASSGYNTGSRSHSRDRTQSPHEKVLRFVFESPSRICPRSSSPTKNESWSFKKAGARHNPRRDSGVGSDGYESEHSYRRVPSDDLSKSGRISPVYNSTKQGLIHDFVKSWPKEMASHHEAPGNFSDTRRHKVEQWLHMNDMNEEDFPFGFHGDPHAKMAARKSSIHDNLSSAYATMRPREFMRYGRSSSDKISSESSADYFSPFDEGPRCARSPQIEAVRNRLRNVAYSPVSEESSHEAHSLRHSDSSHSSSSVHRINFTISDGRVSTSLTSSPQSASRQAQSFVVSPGEHVIESNTRSTGPPVVQMRVSFNHGNRENKILNVTPQAPQVSTGLWQQQESPRNINIGMCNIKETSPVPGIKKFSTEMVHKVGNNSENQLSTDSNKVRHHSNNASIECEVKTSIKNNVGNKG